MNTKQDKPTIDELLDNLPRYKFAPRKLKGHHKGMTKRSYWQKINPKTESGKRNPEHKDAPYEIIKWDLPFRQFKILKERL